jgi:hypothetical protein
MFFIQAPRFTLLPPNPCLHFSGLYVFLNLRRVTHSTRFARRFLSVIDLSAEREIVMHSIRSTENRQHPRYRMKDTLVAAMQGECDSLACIVDLNRKGIGIFSECEESTLAGKLVVLDLISDENRYIMRSLSARLVFSSPERRHSTDPGGKLIRYGLQFVNLSPLEHRLLDMIIKNYALPEEFQSTLPRGGLFNG